MSKRTNAMESDRDRTSANMTHAPHGTPGAGLEGTGGTSTHRHETGPLETALKVQTTQPTQGDKMSPELAKALSAIQRVRDLHQPAANTEWIIPNSCAYGDCDHDECDEVKIRVCVECSALASEIDGGECFIEYPCTTAKTLDGSSK